MLAKRW